MRLVQYLFSRGCIQGRGWSSICTLEVVYREEIGLVPVLQRLYEYREEVGLVSVVQRLYLGRRLVSLCPQGGRKRGSETRLSMQKCRYASKYVYVFRNKYGFLFVEPFASSFPSPPPLHPLEKLKLVNTRRQKNTFFWGGGVEILKAWNVLKYKNIQRYVQTFCKGVKKILPKSSVSGFSSVKNIYLCA